MIEYFESVDQQLFLYLNQFNTPFFDELMRWITHRFTWIPLYIYLSYIIYKNSNLKHLGIIVLFAVIVVTLSDQISVHLFKNVFMRYRPCHNTILQSKVHLINGCGGLYGFVSSHAANTFAIAIFLGTILHSFYHRALMYLIFWATLVSYSRIYAGVHYPADILFGALLGSVIAWFALIIYRKIHSKLV